MGISLRFLGLSGAVAALVGLGPIAACTTEDTDPAEGTHAAGGSTNGAGDATGAAGDATGSGGMASGTTDGVAGSTAAGGSPAASGTVCSNPIVLGAATPGITDFESYDGGADLSTWSFALGGDASTGVFAGTFGYGDEPDGFPETFEMVTGHDSTYALSISDTLAEEYGGGMGLWSSECLDATGFQGISFWVRGSGPTGEATFKVLMEETTIGTAAAADDTVGTCPGTTDEECVAPSFTFPVTASWTEIQVAWSDFAAGSAAGTQVTPDGRNIWQLQFDIGLVWEPGDSGDYEPIADAYELVIDDLTFY